MTDVATEAAPGTGRGDLDASTYEVLRGRLHERAAELARRAEALNARRLSTFGSAELRLVGTDRVRTEHNCVPRDIMSVGGLMLFGYNVFIGLKPETQVRDVFSLHRFLREGEAFRFDDVDPAALPGLLTDPGFERVSPSSTGTTGRPGCCSCGGWTTACSPSSRSVRGPKTSGCCAGGWTGTACPT
ncbi:MAG TPA: DNA repair ATPase [Micromonosporaceae bacterium]